MYRPPTSSVPVDGIGHEAAAPMSVLRYAQRMREPLVVDDVSRDDRFAREPYFADVTYCSLLAVPILGRGTLRAMLLENRLLRGAGVLRVWVRDDGRGGADFGRGSGLAGLKDRIEALGGRISLNSPPGAGTTLQIALPLSGPARSAWETDGRLPSAAR